MNDTRPTLSHGQRLQRRFGLKAPRVLVTGETAPERLQRVPASGVPVPGERGHAAARAG